MAVGQMAGCNVVVMNLPPKGKEAAVSAARFLKFSFPAIRLSLLVGICAGESKNTKDEDVILGDVVISTHVVESERGTQLDEGIRLYADDRERLGRTTDDIKAFVDRFGSAYNKTYHEENLQQELKVLLDAPSLEGYAYPGAKHDLLFADDLLHQHSSDCKLCESHQPCDAARRALCSDLGCLERDDSVASKYRK
ncbi:hypothetical protein QQS21_000914 [Conoideocrella luteorostrata]|uniref:Nucleoside phosphorylase domain-containing protein n=1 Tax=Conoideocrella luteorostrata TaxID=1105319 RepID=A0AAJ0CXZ1_9HYPO|nr:hypothetical protein QQS21_000914 [Conoideocrella luteorostrata]